MDNIIQFFRKDSFKRIMIFAIIILILYSVRSMINVILLTFIFSFLFDRLVEIVTKKFSLPRKITVVLSYVTIIGLLAYVIIKYLPVIITEISQLFTQITSFYLQPHDNVVFNYIFDLIKNNELSDYLEQGVTFLLKSFTDISTLGIQILISLVLSLFFLLEKPKLIEFTMRFKHSPVIAPFYKEIEYFGKKFVLTFGKVIEAQFIIALINCLLTTTALWILDFPQLIGLSIMVFFLGLIPVAGVIISLFPLGTIAYTVGGFIYVIYLFIIVMVIHSIEAYILNPKLMSSKTNLPVFYTFIVLIFGEHFFGVWGLIIGIPVFVFLLDILDVYDPNPSTNQSS